MDAYVQSQFYRTLCELYSEERLMEHMETLYQLEKPRGYSAFANSTAWCEKVLKDAGFSDVRRIAHKADGETASLDFIMPRAWDLTGRSTLEMVEPRKEMLADSDVSTIYISEYSAPTPAGGVTAELLDYATLDPENPDCKGKFVFYRGYLPPHTTVCHNLAKAGCAGIVFAHFRSAAHAPDKPSWTNGHGHIGWYDLKEDPLAPIFCVTPQHGAELCKLLSEGKVVLHGNMQTKVYDGEIYTVTGTIPGKSTDEFALLGHMYEPFHSDDCQGFGVGVEVGLMLKELIDKGVLPQPEKTLRLIFSMERYGFAAFFANHTAKILAAVSIDSFTCHAYSILGNAFGIVQAPLSLPFFGDMLFNEAMAFCPDVRWNFGPGNMSDDCWASEKTVDIPTIWCVSSCGTAGQDYHHTDDPIFDAVEPELLKKLVPMLAVFTTALICGDREYFAGLAQRLEKTAATWLEEKKNQIAGEAAIGTVSGTDAAWQRQAAEMLYLGRMDSFNRFYPGLVTPAVPAHWADGFWQSLPERELTDAEKEAAAVRYRITSPGVPFSQARVPAQERTCWPGITEMVWALLSPERSVLDAIRLRDAAHGTKLPDNRIRYYLDYFRFLEKYGYLERV